MQYVQSEIDAAHALESQRCLFYLRLGVTLGSHHVRGNSNAEAVGSVDLDPFRFRSLRGLQGSYTAFCSG